MALSAAQALPLIEQYESGGRNIRNLTGSTASGYYQIINGTWAQFAPQAGVSVDQYPTAMSAPRDVQSRVATAIFNQQGIAPWGSNTRLMTAIGDTGSATGTGSPMDILGTATGGTTAPSTSPIPDPAADTSKPPKKLSLLNPVWEIVARSGLMLLGTALIVVALCAMLWSAKSAVVSFGRD